MMINSILVINVFVVSANAGLLISLTAIQKVCNKYFVVVNAQ